MYILETERLKLRQIKIKDFPLLYEILSDEETMRYYPRPYQKSDVEEFINGNIRSYSENGYGLWAMMLKDTGLFIGECGITNQNIDGDIVPEIGYHVNKGFWKKGYATEAADGCLNYGFDILGLRTIYIHTAVNNVPSYRVAEKLGFTKVKEYDKVMKSADIIMKHVVYKKDKIH
ncbi:MAG: GNAT family N-acetyltransferase [Chitinispirillia bacterium]|jgi:RimJ/RimL family protein N-acetyltransferase